MQPLNWPNGSLTARTEWSTPWPMNTAIWPTTWFPESTTTHTEPVSSNGDSDANKHCRTTPLTPAESKWPPNTTTILITSMYGLALIAPRTTDVTRRASTRPSLGADGAREVCSRSNLSLGTSRLRRRNPLAREVLFLLSTGKLWMMWCRCLEELACIELDTLFLIVCRSFWLCLCTILSLIAWIFLCLFSFFLSFIAFFFSAWIASALFWCWMNRYFMKIILDSYVYMWWMYLWCCTKWKYLPKKHNL